MQLNSIEEIIDDIRMGKMVIIMDDEDRENEGDLLMAANMVRPEDINFMARYGRGLICLTLTDQRCQQLRLPLMVTDNNEKHSTNFTLSIEAAEGVTTGISAADRAVTVQAAVRSDAGPADIVQPGHIFPLMAQSGGVLTRAGHTEAGCDLARSAGLEPAAVIVEILNEDGTMARRPDLEIFAQEHNLKIGTIADLIEYRIQNERSVERISECNLPTEYGDFRLVAYRDSIEDELHMVLVHGQIDAETPALVRVHMQNSLCDLFHPESGGCGLTLEGALRRIASVSSGVLVLLRKKENHRDIVRLMQEFQLREKGVSLPQQDKVSDLRQYGVGAQILADLGVKKMRVIMSAPKTIHALSGFGLEVVETVGY